MSAALQPVDLRAEKGRVPQPVKHPAGQQHNERHRHQVAQNGHDAGRQGRESGSHAHRDGSPQLQHRNHGRAECQQQLSSKSSQKRFLQTGHEPPGALPAARGSVTDSLTYGGAFGKLRKIELFQLYRLSRMAMISAMASSRASETMVTPHSRTTGLQLAGAKPSAATVSMEMSLASSPAQ